MSARAARGLWITLVQPILEYGAEIDAGRWTEAEALLRMAGRLCLGVGREVPDEVVRGDLGFWTVQARREFLMLVYWGKIVREGGDTIVQAVYKEGRSRVGRGVAREGEWCMRVKRLLTELGMENRWVSERVGEWKEWRREVYEMIRTREEIKWRRAVARKPSLKWYFSVKRTLRQEWFLGEHRVWVKRWARLRASAACLEVVRGRRKGILRDRRMCACGEGVEDEVHFLDGCKNWMKERRELWDGLSQVDALMVRRVMGWRRVERVKWLLGGGGGVRGRQLVVRGIGKWMTLRERAR